MINYKFEFTLSKVAGFIFIVAGFVAMGLKSQDLAGQLFLYASATFAVKNFTK